MDNNLSYLKQFRKSKGLGQMDIADYLKTPQSSWSKYESLTTRLPSELIPKLVHLGAIIEDILREQAIKFGGYDPRLHNNSIISTERNHFFHGDLYQSNTAKIYKDYLKGNNSSEEEFIYAHPDTIADSSVMADELFEMEGIILPPHLDAKKIRGRIVAIITRRLAKARAGDAGAENELRRDLSELVRGLLSAAPPEPLTP